MPKLSKPHVKAQIAQGYKEALKLDITFDKLMSGPDTPSGMAQEVQKNIMYGSGDTLAPDKPVLQEVARNKKMIASNVNTASTNLSQATELLDKAKPALSRGQTVFLEDAATNAKGVVQHSFTAHRQLKAVENMTNEVIDATANKYAEQEARNVMKANRRAQNPAKYQQALNTLKVKTTKKIAGMVKGGAGFGMGAVAGIGAIKQAVDYGKTRRMVKGLNAMNPKAL